MCDVVGHVTHSVFTIESVTGYAGQDPEMVLRGDCGCPTHMVQPAQPCPRCLLPGVTGPCIGSGEASQGPDIRAWAQGRTQVTAEAQHVHRPCAGVISRWWGSGGSYSRAGSAASGAGVTGEELTGRCGGDPARERQ